MKRYLKSIKNINKDQSGFTLLETVIGVAIFSIGLLGIYVFQSVSIDSNSLAQTATENTHFAMQTVEDIFAMDWDSNATQPTAAITEPRDGGDYQVTWEITENPEPGVVAMADDSNRPNVRLITVTSTYVDKGGMPRSVTFRMLKPRM